MQTQPHIPKELAAAGCSLEPAVIFEGHIYAHVFGETYRLDYVPVEISESEAKKPMNKGSWLGYELAKAICRELRATVQSERAVLYLKGGPVRTS